MDEPNAPHPAPQPAENPAQSPSETPHKRRVRYKGTHPRAFKEKYKELQPDKYAEDVAKVLARGSTPAGMHRPICVDEIMEVLRIQPGETGFDATLGYGGHASEMLRRLDGRGHLTAVDVDPLELPRTRDRLAAQGFGPEILTVRQMNFAGIDRVVAESGPLDFAMADLGVSSMQIDDPDRGFSYKRDGPLDMRLDPRRGTPAAARLKELSQPELEGMFRENADEPYAAEIARAVVAELRRGTVIETTAQLRRVITDALRFLRGPDRDAELKKSCQRCFQALRIDVNDEFLVLYDFLEKLPAALAPGGRVAILSFHSGEDRLVKKSFQHYFREGVYREIAPGPVRPSAEECSANSRAHSAKLRWAVRA